MMQWKNKLNVKYKDDDKFNPDGDSFTISEGDIPSDIHDSSQEMQMENGEKIEEISM